MALTSDLCTVENRRESRTAPHYLNPPLFALPFPPCPLRLANAAQAAAPKRPNLAESHTATLGPANVQLSIGELPKSFHRVCQHWYTRGY